MEITFDKDKKIGVGVSGGADSMVLLHLLVASGANVVAINIEHGIRGASSLADTEFVKNVCKDMNVECLAFSLDVPRHAGENGLSLETSARLLRYEVFDGLLKNGTVDVIALAHHQCDQTETILMRLFRGTGVRGLRGIVDRPGYIHPLLGYSKADIVAYATEHTIKYCTDETNLDVDYNRNFLRNNVIPLIEERYPALNRSLGRMAEGMNEVEDYLLSRVTPYEEADGACILPLAAFERHIAIAKKSLAECLRKGMGILKDIETRHLDSVVDLAKNKAIGASVDLPFGVVAHKLARGVALYKKPETEDLCEEVKLGKIYNYGSVCYQMVQTNQLVPHVTFDLDKLPKDAVVRYRKRGDLFKRYGGGTKPFAEYLTDIKYPPWKRDALPIIAADGVVYVVPGVEVSDLVKVDKQTVHMVKIVYK